MDPRTANQSGNEEPAPQPLSNPPPTGAAADSTAVAICYPGTVCYSGSRAIFCSGSRAPHHRGDWAICCPGTVCCSGSRALYHRGDWGHC